MAFDFPSNPAVGDVFKPVDGAAYYWTGVAWMNKGAAADYVNVGGDVMTGPLILAGLPTAPPMAASKAYVDQQVGNQGNNVAISGDTMTGPLILSEHPTAASPEFQAATKGFVGSIAGMPPGGTVGQVLAINTTGVPQWGAAADGGNFITSEGIF